MYFVSKRIYKYIIAILFLFMFFKAYEQLLGGNPWDLSSIPEKDYHKGVAPLILSISSTVKPFPATFAQDSLPISIGVRFSRGAAISEAYFGEFSLPIFTIEWDLSRSLWIYGQISLFPSSGDYVRLSGYRFGYLLWEDAGATKQFSLEVGTDRVTGPRDFDYYSVDFSWIMSLYFNTMNIYGMWGTSLTSLKTHIDRETYVFEREDKDVVHSFTMGIQGKSEWKVSPGCAVTITRTTWLVNLGGRVKI
jgi:hypothetical protein